MERRSKKTRRPELDSGSLWFSSSHDEKIPDRALLVRDVGIKGACPGRRKLVDSGSLCFSSSHDEKIPDRALLVRDVGVNGLVRDVGVKGACPGRRSKKTRRPELDSGSL